MTNLNTSSGTYQGREFVHHIKKSPIHLVTQSLSEAKAYFPYMAESVPLHTCKIWRQTLASEKALKRTGKSRQMRLHCKNSEYYIPQESESIERAGLKATIKFH